ncbi:ribosomal protein L1 [Pseudovirgaria hyperparasitica]|uniref:Ribosomal protein L1 n=1 Tax=Pseudovirgaria hyperparasitica TaxID=470096 RepID=A0A6A6WJI0_9PEZI|nr:ribosomal protein L1 [Pseudovirgaria hyperparasitica]KAF2762366.1 ribosomal protein L1 [Pseudovirgaria hyperparasitica]
MARDSKALAVKSDSQAKPEPTQILKATKALVKHIRKDLATKEGDEPKTNLLADADQEDDDDEDDVPVWLLITTKKHIVDKQRLKPGKVKVPHTLHASPNTRICLITADPQRRYKDIVAHPSFPPTLASRIGRVIGMSKLKAKYKSYESRRQLYGEYDMFLADDRIITGLPQVLGKIFYKGSAKRPIPVSLIGDEKKSKDAVAKRPQQSAKEKVGAQVGEAQAVARDIERALSSALVHLSPGTSTSIKIGLASWDPKKLQENVEALVPAVVEKFVPQKWANVRSIHIKGPHTTALPIWLAEELWVDENVDVTETKFEPPTKLQRRAERRERRKLIEAAEATYEAPSAIEEFDEVNEDGVIENPSKKRKRIDKDVADMLAVRKATAKKMKQKVMDEAGGVSL